MTGQIRKTIRLKELFESPKMFILAGGANPLQAQLAEMVGFEAFYMSGANTAAHLIGWPDVGVITMREMVDNAQRIVMAVNIPVFSDSDTGYGNAVQVYRTVQEFIQAGVAGIHIEDQESPKKSGSMAGRRLPGPVLPLIHGVVQLHPTLEQQEAAGCAAAFYPGLTTMAGLQASWEFLNDFRERGTPVLQEFRERAEQSKLGAIDNNRVTKLPRIRQMEERYLPKELWRDYEHTLGLRPE